MEEDRLKKLDEEIDEYLRAIEAAEEALREAEEALDEAELPEDPEDEADWIMIF